MVVKNCITFDDYRKCLFEQETIMCQQNNVRSRKHIVRTETEQKVALSSHDDKRHLLPNTTDTLPWGYCDVSKAIDEDEAQLLEVLMHSVTEEEEPITDQAVGEGAHVVVGVGLHKELSDNAEHIRSFVEQEEEPPSKRSRV